MNKTLVLALAAAAAMICVGSLTVVARPGLNARHGPAASENGQATGQDHQCADMDGHKACDKPAEPAPTGCCGGGSCGG